MEYETQYFVKIEMGFERRAMGRGARLHVNKETIVGSCFISDHCSSTCRRMYDICSGDNCSCGSGMPFFRHLSEFRLFPTFRLFSPFFFRACSVCVTTMRVNWWLSGQF